MSSTDPAIHTTATTHGAATDLGGPERPFGAPPSPPERGPSSGRRLGFLAATAAAVVALVAGVLVLAPDNTTPALAAVQEAAEDTANADTGRATTTFSVEGGTETERESVGGQLDAVFAGQDLAVTVEITDGIEEYQRSELDQIESRLVDGVVYGRESGGEWIAIEAPEIVGDQLTQFIDPRSVLETVQSLIETEEVGSTTIDGVDTTQYQSIIDLGDDTLGQSGWLSGLEAQLDVDPDGLVTVDLYIDNDGNLRQIDITGDVEATDSGETGDATFSVSTVFSDIGSDLTVEAPEGVEVQSLFDGLGED